MRYPRRAALCAAPVQPPVRSLLQPGLGKAFVDSAVVRVVPARWRHSYSHRYGGVQLQPRIMSGAQLLKVD